LTLGVRKKRKAAHEATGVKPQFRVVIRSSKLHEVTAPSTNTVYVV